MYRKFRNAYKISGGKPERKESLEILGYMEGQTKMGVKNTA
jgi:hypothetical protein